MEYNCYGRQEDKEKMIIARVVTVEAVRAGFETIAVFNTNDDGAQYSAYVEELKLRAARYDMILDYFKKGEVGHIDNLLKRCSEPKA